MNSHKVTFAAVLPTVSYKVFQRLLTYFLLLFFTINPFVSIVSAAEIGHNPQVSSYDTVVDGIGQSPNTSVTTPSGALPLNTPVAPLSSSAQVEISSGAFVDAYDFNLPKGPGGIIPPLALSYDSRRRNYDGSFGIGFTLDIPTISRINKFGIDRMYEDSSFSSSIHGELVKLSKEQDAYGVYGVKNGYGRYIFNRDNSWSYINKEGVTYVFGAKSTEREFISTDDTKISQWNLSTITDPYKHTYRYVYDKVSEKLFPIAILYPNDIYKVDIGWNRAPQTTLTYENGYGQGVGSRRATQVTLSALGVMYRTHAFTFNPSTLRLEKITDSVLGDTVFTYTDIENPRNAVVVEKPLWNVTQHRVDIDGDGQQDIYRVEANTTPTKRTLTIGTTVYQNMPQFDGFADINNDGAVDGYSTDGCYRTYQGNGVFSAAICNLGLIVGDKMIFEDINNDGIIEYITAAQGHLKVYTFKDGKYTLNPSMKAVGGTMWDDLTNSYMATFDVNGDNQKDILIGGDAYLNRGVFFEFSNNYQVDTSNRYYFPNAGKLEYQYILTPVDYNGDGLLEIKIDENWKEQCSSSGTGWCAKVNTQKFLNSGHGWIAVNVDYWNNFTSFTQEKVPLITKVADARLETDVVYGLEDIAKSNILGSIKKVIVVKSITSPYSQTNYSYTNGKYYFNQKEQTSEFAGFETVVATDGLGRKSISYFHQGNDTNTAKGEFEDSRYKIGRTFRQEFYGATGTLLKTITTKWIQADLGSERYLVVPEYTSQLIDGVGTAVGYTYDTAVGELVRQYNFGDATVNTDGSFTDVGIDLVITKYHYKTNGALVVRDEEQRERNGEQLFHGRYTYNPALTQLVKEEVSEMPGSFASRTFSYTSDGSLSSSTDFMGNTTTYTYDSYKFLPKTITNALGHITTLEYNYVVQKPIKVVTPDAITSTYVYDLLGNELEYYRNGVKERVASVSNNFKDYTYSQTLNTSTSIPASDTYVQKVVNHDGLMRPVYERDTDGNHIATTYDQYGRVAEKTIPYTGMLTDSKKIRFTYDDLDRVITQTTVDGVTRYAYNGRTVTITSPSDTIKMMEYDSAGNLIAATEGGFTTRYTYNGNNNLVKLVDQEGNIKEQSFNLLGRKLMTTDLRKSIAADYGRYYFVYDRNGNLTQEIKPGNVTVLHTYDTLGRSKTTTSGEDTITYTYDTCMPGKLCSETRGAYYSKTYTYTPKGQIKTVTEKIHDKTSIVQYEYMGAGDLVTKITYPGNIIITYEYQKDKLVQIKKNGTSLLSSVQYDFGRLKQLQFANGLKTVNAYNENNLYRLSQRVTTNSGNTKLQDIGYTYNSLGMIASLVDSSDTPTKKSVTYVYDDVQRLLTVTYTISSDTTTENFTYSPSGNLLSSPRGTMTYGETVSPQQMNMEVIVPEEEQAQSSQQASENPPIIHPENPESPIMPTVPSGNSNGRNDEVSYRHSKWNPGGLLKATIAYAEEVKVGEESGRNDQEIALDLDQEPESSLQNQTLQEKALSTCGEDGVLIADCVISQQQADPIECLPPGILASGRCLMPESWTNSETSCPPASERCSAIVNVNCLENEVPTDGGCARKVTAMLASDSVDSDPLTLDQLVDRLRGKLITIYQTGSGMLMTLINGESGETGVRIRNDIAGKVVMPRDAQTIAVSFEKALSVVPTITITPQGPITGTPYITSVSTTGFTINVTSPVLQDVIFHYYAFGIPESELQTVGTIPQPTTPTEPSETECPLGFEKDAQQNCIPEVDTSDPVEVVHPHAVTSQEKDGSVTSYTYDARGNLLNDGTYTYVWSNLNELMSSQDTNTTVRYNYSPSHDKIYEEEVSGDTGSPMINKTYFFSSLINRNGMIEIALPYGIVLKNGTPIYTFTDHLGTVQVIANQAGVATDVFDTYAYGDERVKTGTTDAKYALHEYDNNLIYMKARYYDPATGSFISQDPTVLLAPEQYIGDPLQLNAYGYARGNPVMHNDPDGNQAVAAMVIAPALESSAMLALLGSSATWLSRSRDTMLLPLMGMHYLMSRATENNQPLPIPQGLSLPYVPNPEDPDDFLKSVDESRRNGHVRSKHVKNSRSNLLQELESNPNSDGATSFRSSKTAEQAIKNGLNNNQSHINNFLNNERVGERTFIDYNTGNSIGYGYTKLATGEIIKVNSIKVVRIVIEKMSRANYKIITSFPKAGI
ncbi:MAG TPA: RNase A-like domain-containing protein [Candidatus Paceibacterota bacterium]